MIQLGDFRDIFQISSLIECFYHCFQVVLASRLISLGSQRHAMTLLPEAFQVLWLVLAVLAGGASN